MDIKIKCDEGLFKFRVCGIICKDDKFLVVKIAENKFYCLPGGHVRLGETTGEAVLRELSEEVWFKTKIKKLLYVHENIFFTETGKPFNEIGYYYLATPTDKNFIPEDKTIIENDEGHMVRLEFKWVTKEDLKKSDFRPLVIKELIQKLTPGAHCINISTKEKHDR